MADEVPNLLVNFSKRTDEDQINYITTRLAAVMVERDQLQEEVKRLRELHRQEC